MDEVHSRPPSSMSKEMSEEELQENYAIYNHNEGEEMQINIESPGSEILPTSNRPSKRYRAETDSDEHVKTMDNDGFTVVKRKIKRAELNKVDIPDSAVNRPSSYDVCVVSYEMLPKQIGLARLLKSENITNATHIKYKNAYKVIISFEKREDALCLINNKKLVDLGYRCHFTTEVDLSYGIVKYLEVDMSDDELIKAFSADCKIVSVKRLRRLSDNGEWINSETVRFGFKSSVLPSYINGFDCRFKVEQYTFPVSQCSNCWKFGHLARTCPSRTRCPKCGGSHSNCEVTKLQCVNCKGQHISFNKTCPAFIKEKEIRHIMSKNNCTYKAALCSYLENKPLQLENTVVEPRPDINRVVGEERNQLLMSDSLYSSVLQRKPIDQRIESEESSEIEIDNSRNASVGDKKKKNKKSKNPKTVLKDAEENQKEIHNTTAASAEENEKIREDAKKRTSFIGLLRKIRAVIVSNDRLEDKVQKVFKVLFEELVLFVVRSVSNGEVFSQLMGFFNYG